MELITKCPCGCGIPYYGFYIKNKAGIIYFKECTGDWWIKLQIGKRILGYSNCQGFNYFKEKLACTSPHYL